MCHRLVGANLGDVWLISSRSGPLETLHPMKTGHLTSQQPAGCQRHSQPVALGGRTQGSAVAPESWPAHWSCSLEQGSVPGPAWQRKIGQMSCSGHHSTGLSPFHPTPNAGLHSFIIQLHWSHRLREASDSCKHSTTVGRCRWTALCSVCTSRSKDVSATYLVRVERPYCVVASSFPGLGPGWAQSGAEDTWDCT